MKKSDTVFYQNVIFVLFLINGVSLFCLFSISAKGTTKHAEIVLHQHSSDSGQPGEKTVIKKNISLEEEKNGTSCSLNHFQVWIVVHGTYAKNAVWYKKDGEFFESLKAALPAHAQLYSFSWSGKLKHEKRIQAGHELVEFIEKHVPLYAQICIVAHSYGCAVAILAAHELYEKKSLYRISKLFTLGSPVSSYYYNPNMEYIDSLYNIFSFGDVIQPLFGLAARVYSPHAHIWNIEMRKEDHCPDHNDLHCGELASLLPLLPTLVKGNDTTVLHFKKDKKYVCEEDLEREKALEIDKKNIENILKQSCEFVRKGHAKKYFKKATKYARKSISKKFK